LFGALIKWISLPGLPINNFFIKKNLLIDFDRSLAATPIIDPGKRSPKRPDTEGQVVVSDGSHGASLPLIGVKGKKSTKYWSLSQLHSRNQFKYRSCSNKMIGTLSIKQMIYYNYI
jgi:hypothetical protein